MEFDRFLKEYPESRLSGCLPLKANELDIAYRRFLDEAGNPVAELPEFARREECLRDLYRWMHLTREFDARAVMLQRSGRLGTFPSSLGQEATSVGLAHAMRDEDVLVPSFREQGAQLLRGVSAVELLLYWAGDERGSDYAVPREDFPVSVPVGSHAAHAAGVALALSLRGEDRAVVCVFGDGATSKGDVYEAMNFAGLWGLPLVFVVVNNGWAISTPRAAQTAAQTLAQKSLAAGFGGVQVDGNDVIAVRQVVAEALAGARAGEGPSLVEAVTYRLADHTTADDAGRYRDESEVTEHWKQDPLPRLRNYLVASELWSKRDEQELLDWCRGELDLAVSEFEARPPQPPQEMFAYLFAELPVSLAGQREVLLARLAAESAGD
jgi:pyruvate dehydrogenase E1 component alpha subunit